MLSTQALKYTIRRARPNILLHTKRITRWMRTCEDGTFSMPSGDSSAGALCCFEFAVMLGLPAIYVILPLVMCGRVYHHCHWFGDTIAGAVIGSLWGLIMVLVFPYLISLHQAIAGPNSFQPLQA